MIEHLPTDTNVEIELSDGTTEVAYRRSDERNRKFDITHFNMIEGVVNDEKNRPYCI